MGRLSESPNVLPKPGDICQSCLPFWESRNRSHGIRLIALDSKTTDQKQIPIVVCPWCDGEPIVRMNQHGG